MSHLFPNYARWPVNIVKGEGGYLWDDRGKRYLDLVSGIAVTSLGHAPQRVKERVAAQLDALWHCSNLFQIPLQEEAAARLARLSGLDRAFFCNSGAEANEAAIKLARKYGQHVLGKEKFEVITFANSFHGRTLATLTATGQAKVKDGFAPLPEGFVTVPYNDLEAFKTAVTPRTCAVLLELVQGEGGVHPADPAWVRDVHRFCRENGILFMVDEVQTGIGRTGSWFAFQQYEIEPDVVTLAKGLGSGFPVGAMLAKEKLAEAFGPGSHGSTFGGNPLAMAAVLATLDVIAEEGLLEKVKELGAYFLERLRSLEGKYPIVREARGKGFLLGLEVTVPAADIVTALREKGVLVLTAGPQVLRLLPPFTITRQEIDQAVRALEETLAQAAETGGSGNIADAAQDAGECAAGAAGEKEAAAVPAQAGQGKEWKA
ncbi:acetylornithine transaminase [Bacillaceae bacterium]